MTSSQHCCRHCSASILTMHILMHRICGLSFLPLCYCILTNNLRTNKTSILIHVTLESSFLGQRPFLSERLSGGHMKMRGNGRGKERKEKIAFLG